MSKCGKFYEKYHPIFIATLTSIVFYWQKDTLLIKKLYAAICDCDFLTAILTVSSIIFGFLLTAFTLIYQSDSFVIKELKKINRFTELISYNKVAVKWAFYQVVLTSLLLLISDDYMKIPYHECAVSFWIFATIYTCLLSIRFLNIFYLII